MAIIANPVIGIFTGSDVPNPNPTAPRSALSIITAARLEIVPAVADTGDGFIKLSWQLQEHEPPLEIVLESRYALWAGNQIVRVASTSLAEAPLITYLLKHEGWSPERVSAMFETLTDELEAELVARALAAQQAATEDDGFE